MPNTFGIDIADLQAVVTNLNISTSTSPTTSQVEELIEYAAAEVALEAEAVGVSLDGLNDPTSNMYLIFKRAIVYRVVADVLTAKNRGNPESGQYYMDLHNKLLDNIRKYPDRIASRSEDVGPNRMKYITRTEANNNPYVIGTIPGKIISNNTL